MFSFSYNLCCYPRQWPLLALE